MPKFKLVNCSTCGRKYRQKIKTYQRAILRGYTHKYCSIKCNPHAYREDSPFKWMMRKIIGRRRTKAVEINSIYLEDLYRQQNKLCAITKIPLLLKREHISSHPLQASVDRIDNSKGYIPGNVRLTSLMANLARWKFSDEQLIDFCKETVKNLPIKEIRNLLDEKISMEMEKILRD